MSIGTAEAVHAWPAPGRIAFIYGTESDGAESTEHSFVKVSLRL